MSLSRNPQSMEGHKHHSTSVLQLRAGTHRTDDRDNRSIMSPCAAEDEQHGHAATGPGAGCP